MCVESVDEFIGRHRSRIGGSKFRTLHKGHRERLFVILQDPLPTGRVNDHSGTDLTTVWPELAQIRRARERSEIEPVYKISCLLELDREKESSRYVYPFDLNAIQIRTATGNLVRPE